MENKNLEVYTDDLGFRVGPSAAEEFSRKLKEAQDQTEQLIFEMLDERVYFEHDTTDYVLLVFTEAITDEWYKRGNWDDIEGLIDPIEEGKYDDEMKRYYAYLQATAIEENIKLIDFSDEDNIEGSLEVNNIYVYDDAIQFRVAGVLDSVERTYDLEADVKRLLVVVMRSLKNTGETIDFTRWYL